MNGPNDTPKEATRPPAPAVQPPPKDGSPEAPDAGVALTHHREVAQYTKAAATLEGKSRQVALGRLLAFLGATILVAAGVSGNDGLLLGLAGGATAVFFLLVRVHASIDTRKRDAEARKAVHERHLLRLTGRFTELPATGKATPGHPYAHDIDLAGENSLCQRIDTSHTLLGEATLVRWLSQAEDREIIAERQAAVGELSEKLKFRENLEAHGTIEGDGARLDPASFLAFTKRAPYVRGTWRSIAAILLPLSTVTLFVLGKLGLVPPMAAMVTFGLSTALALACASATVDAFQLVAARRGYVESLKGMLVAIEEERFDAPLLQEIQSRISVGGRKPSVYMAHLDRWAGLAEFYTQFPIHFFVNIATLWDLHVLGRLEKWNADIGAGLEDAFDALGELEALASLATLHHGDPEAHFPEVMKEDAPLTIEGLAHPLLRATERVANDLAMPSANSAQIITGSNMAGKSTMLRAVGLNIALALAGGPVIARRMRLSPVRLRASMRVDDSLQEGASYFHAELAKLRSVVGGAEAKPPLFFLLDELLRGTNARARHVGARAVLSHLLRRGASGLTATHDVALARMADEGEFAIRNVHFTDVMKDDEMIFDYKLRDGVVRTSNALRLLEMVGVEVEVDDRLPEGIG